jgi:penicillin-binding protein 2
MIRAIKKKFKQWFNPSLNKEITPDEIFLDSSNLPGFDTDQFEGRLEKPISQKVLSLLFFSFILVTLTFFGRAWILQVKHGEAYLERSENNRLRHNLVFSNRGLIFDRRGEEIATNTVHPEGESFSLRHYQELPGMSHLIGYVKYPEKDKAGFYYQTEFVGKEGVEKAYNEVLLGENGLQLVETDALGNVTSESMNRPPVDGESLTLSIDSRVQSELFEIIARASEQFGFQGGAGAIMDVHSGELLALTSFPEFDSEILSLGSDASIIDSWLNDPAKPFFNRMVSGLYAPGSVIKPFLSVAALNERIIDPQKEIYSGGSLIVPNPYFPDQPSVFTDWKAHGLVDMVDALAVSSNVYFYQISGGFEDQKGLGIIKVKKYLKEFGLSEKTGINLPGENAGVIPDPSWKMEHFQEEWRLGDTYNTAIGQYGLQVTPLQILRGITALANEGTLLEPTVVKREKPANSESVSIDNAIFYDIVKQGMRASVERGTSSGLSVPYVEIASKTGTAEVGKRFLNSWVTGFFPFNSPKYAFVVLMDRGPRNNTVGGVYVMRQLLDWMNAYTPEYLK